MSSKKTCPSCAFEFEEGSVCPVCGFELETSPAKWVKVLFLLLLIGILLVVFTGGMSWFR